MNQPQNRFQGAPSPHPAPLPAPLVGRTEAGVAFVPPTAAPLPRAVPTLTVYADGEANLNAEASGLLGFSTEGLCLRRPPAVRAGSLPQLWELGRGECYPVRKRPDKLLLLRFRVEPDESPAPGRYLLLPVAGAQDRFSLLPG